MWDVFITLPLWYQYSLVFILGTILGSFLDVYLLRFHTGYSIGGHSHCCSCGTRLRWFDLVPVVSYLTLRGRCRVCHARIPFRLLGMEIGTGLLLLGVYTISDTAIEFVLAGLLAILLFLIAIYDKRHFIIPNSLVVSVAVVAILITGVALWPRGDIVTVLPALAAGVAAGGFFASLWLVSKGRWIGLGDAKLALPLGFLVGPWGAFSFVVLSFWVGAVVSVALLGLKVLARGKHRLPFGSIPITMKSEVPFAPFMIIAFVLVYFFHIDVLVLMGTWFYAI